MPEDSHCTTMSQMAVMTVKPVADTPERGHGDIEANPSPDPIARRINVVETAANAPAIIEDHDTAEAEDSTVAASAPRTSRRSALTLCMGLPVRISCASTSPAAELQGSVLRASREEFRGPYETHSGHYVTAG